VSVGSWQPEPAQWKGLLKGARDENKDSHLMDYARQLDFYRLNGCAATGSDATAGKSESGSERGRLAADG